MKVIFLDIDGVLNNTITGGVMHWNSTTLDRVALLNKIIDSTGAKLFIISSWVDESFFNNDNEKLKSFLYERGIREGSIEGFRRNGIAKEDGIVEIFSENESIESFIIIDDNATILTNDFLKTRFINTQSLVGLTEEDVNKAIELLSSKKELSLPTTKDQFIGCLVGLAVGDAYGTTYEFKRKDSMPPVSELPDKILGGGPFDMKPGEWTDDTSMALCLAESLTEKGWNTDDQMKKYIDWWQNGYNSVKGFCFDIGGATRSALSCYNMVGTFVIDPQAAGNGVLMRLAALPMFYQGDTSEVLRKSAIQSTMTHPSPQSIQCSMYLGAVINKILSGETDKNKIVLYDNLFNDEEKIIYNKIVSTFMADGNFMEVIKTGGYIERTPEYMSGDGYCVATLMSALWAFYNTESFLGGLKLIVSLGDDTDTTGAVYGQIAGAYYGVNHIPFVDGIAWIDKIKELAEEIYNQKQQVNEKEISENNC